jgi:NAD(P)H-hydrate repair Nnr-like enzyme with NAD(P)H-hydrate epimerase domain
MHRIIPLIVSVLLCGCGDPSAKPPMLKLTVKRSNGTSVGRYRVSHTGLIAGSGDRGGDGAVAGQSVTIDKIADDGVTVTITISDSAAGESSKQILVPYDKEITVAISKETTVIAQLERKE